MTYHIHRHLNPQNSILLHHSPPHPFACRTIEGRINDVGIDGGSIHYSIVMEPSISTIYHQNLDTLSRYRGKYAF
ncbi:hypothetical protein KSS87_016545 [Heliosperma pusillum]|nr:hypothetical protein KSS87_016545 [Heliosperma pusillum]